MGSDITHIAFAGHDLIGQGTPVEVAAAVKRHVDAHPERPVLVLDAFTSEPIELDLRGTLDDVVRRVSPPADEAATATAPRPVGRPKLGVVAREVTLLPRHWEWLASQPGGASVTLRRLVETARKESARPDEIRSRREATYRFMFAVAGDAPGFEEAVRALYAGDARRFAARTEAWPPAVADHARRLAAPTFEPEAGEVAS